MPCIPLILIKILTSHMPGVTCPWFPPDTAHNHHQNKWKICSKHCKLLQQKRHNILLESKVTTAKTSHPNFLTAYALSYFLFENVAIWSDQWHIFPFMPDQLIYFIYFTSFLRMEQFDVIITTNHAFSPSCLINLYILFSLSSKFFS